MSYNGQVIAYCNTTTGYFISVNGGSTFTTYTLSATSPYGGGSPNINMTVSPFGNMVVMEVGYGLSQGSFAYFYNVAST
jgi:hypothetical protein